MTGDNSIVNPEVKRSVYIEEPDEALSLLLRTTFELQGYDVADKLDIDSNEQPGVIILDSNEDMSGLDFCRKVKNNRHFVNTKIVVTSTVHDKSAVLDAGADLYLPKPYEMSDLVMWVEYLLKG